MTHLTPLALLFFSFAAISVSESQEFVYPFEGTERWGYDCFYNNGPSYPTHYIMSFGPDTLMPNGRTYRPLSNGTHEFLYRRVDSCRVYDYWQEDSSEFVRYDFAKQPGDTIWVIPQRWNTAYIYLSEVKFATVFGHSRRVFVFHSTDGRVWDEVADGIGTTVFGITPEDQYTLTGAYIRGTLYGSLTSVLGFDEPYPDSPLLLHNYPNPFNPSTKIQFHLPEHARVRLSVHDVLGQELERLLDGDATSGRHEIEWRAEGHSGGVYYCRLVAGGVQTVRPMLLLR